MPYAMPTKVNWNSTRTANHLLRGSAFAVNLDRATMPRKSTWFTPKARAGLVVADLTAEV